MNVLSSEIKKNIAIEDDLDEQISLIINHPVNEQKIISTLQNALALKNIIMFEKENGDLIIKRNSNVKVDAPISKKGLTGFQIFIVNLKSTDPNTMAQFLRQFFPETNDINPSPNGKGITFIGNENDYSRLLNLIERFDVKATNKGIQINLKHIKSEEVYTIVKSLIDSGNWLVNPDNNVTIVNLKKLNAVYVSAPENSINQWQSFIMDLDNTDEIEKNGHVKKDQNEEQKKINIDKIDKISNLENVQGFEVIDLKYADANEIENTLKEFTILDDNMTSSSNGLSIKSYIPGNQIIVSGNKFTRTKIIKLIQDLDKPIKQVFVEAIVAELSTSKAKELGLQFSGSSGKAG